MGEKQMNPNLISLWNKYYNPNVLERLDLSKEWNFISSNNNYRLRDLIKAWNDKLTKKEMEQTLQSFDTLFGYLDKVKEVDSSIFIFSILTTLEYNIRNNRLDIVRVLTKHLKNFHPCKQRKIPSKLIIELTNNCNLNCKMCGVGEVNYSSQRTMPLILFNQIIDNLADTTDTFRLNGLGESTIIPNFKEYLSIFEDKNVQLELVTNLSIKNNDLIIQLLKMDFNLFISCDSPNPERLVSIRKGLKIVNFIDNLELIKNYEGRDPMRNQIIFTVMEENFRDLPDMVEFAANYNIGGIIGNMVKEDDNRWKILKFNELIKTFEKAHEIAKKNGIKLRLPNQIEGIPIKENFVFPTNSGCCHIFKDEIFIRYNGDVCPCNMMNPYMYGNIKNKEITEILNGFQSMIFANLINTKFKHPYCEHCYYIQEKFENY